MDIAIAGVAALSQFITAYLGWKVTTTPTLLHNPKTQRICEWLFVLAGAAGIITVVASSWRANVSQTELRTEIRVVTGADNFVYLAPDLEARTERGFQVTAQGRGSISAGSYFIVPATATDPKHPDYRRGRAVPFLAIHSGMRLNEYLPAGDWRIEFISTTTGHYNQFVEIGDVDGKPTIKRQTVIRADGKQLFP